MFEVDNPFVEEPFFRVYSINYEGLSGGIHKFRFLINDEFFSYLPFSLISKGNVLVEVELEKQKGSLHMHVRMRGEVEVRCDRCAEPFMYPVDIHRRLIVKFTDKVATIERDQELMLVPPHVTTLYLAQDFYDFLLTSLPMQIVHPEGKCNQEVIQILQQYTSEQANSVDPRWGPLEDILLKAGEGESKQSNRTST